MSAVAPVTEAEVAISKELLFSRDWRMDNLYRIKDENGRTVKFTRREAQRAFDDAMWYRNVIPKARKLGFSTFIGMFILDETFFRGGTIAGIVDRTLDDAKDKLGMIRFAYEQLPEELRRTRTLERANDSYIEFNNGSSISVGLSYRGGTPRILHISEYGKTSVVAPDLAKEIKTGAIQAVPLGGFVFAESTAHGTSGEFYDMVQQAEKVRLSGVPLTRLDFRSHFFGWNRKPEYRLPNNLVTIPADLREYFEELRVKHSIRLDADQMAWYAKKLEELGPDDIRQEYPSHQGELFYSSIQGAYWKRELTKARAEGRIGQKLPHDPSRRVNTFWDIGEDGTAIWFHQTDGVRHRFIDHYEEEGGSIQSAAAVVDKKRSERGFIYHKHYGPHDLEDRVWAAKARSKKEIAKELGIDFVVVPRVSDKGDSIEAGRRMLNLSWFDDEHCRRGVECLDNYRKQWNERLGIFKAEPIHDWASHTADAYQQGAMGLEPEPVQSKRGRGIGDEKKGTSWAQ